jgi:peptide/nickel transport system substrate-binding protein
MSNSATVVDNPILPGYLGYNPVASHYDFDLAKAKSILGQSSTYNQQKDKELLLVSLDDPQSVALAQMVKNQWESLGLKIKLKSANLEDLQKNYIKPRNYDVLLYGQNIGLDSDVYSFWHSSQVNDPGLNLSYYKSTGADRLIEDGRFARDSQTKSSKYYGFADTWAKDQPAILLYNPYYLYGVEKIVSGMNASKIVEPSDRFYNIEDWAIKKRLQLKIKHH